MFWSLEEWLRVICLSDLQVVECHPTLFCCQYFTENIFYKMQSVFFNNKGYFTKCKSIINHPPLKNEYLDRILQSFYMGLDTYMKGYNPKDEEPSF